MATLSYGLVNIKHSVFPTCVSYPTYSQRLRGDGPSDAPVGKDADSTCCLNCWICWLSARFDARSSATDATNVSAGEDAASTGPGYAFGFSIAGLTGFTSR